MKILIVLFILLGIMGCNSRSYHQKSDHNPGPFIVSEIDFGKVISYEQLPNWWQSYTNITTAEGSFRIAGMRIITTGTPVMLRTYDNGVQNVNVGDIGWMRVQ